MTSLGMFFKARRCGQILSTSGVRDSDSWGWICVLLECWPSSLSSAAHLNTSAAWQGSNRRFISPDAHQDCVWGCCMCEARSWGWQEGIPSRLCESQGDSCLLSITLFTENFPSAGGVLIRWLLNKKLNHTKNDTEFKSPYSFRDATWYYLSKTSLYQKSPHESPLSFRNCLLFFVKHKSAVEHSLNVPIALVVLNMMGKLKGNEMLIIPKNSSICSSCITSLVWLSIKCQTSKQTSLVFLKANLPWNCK